jgi:CRISPR associated protein Cas1
LACLAVGADPSFGILHLDAAGRDSLVFDLMEPLRPEVERFALDLLAEATFSRKDFVERTDGSVKMGPAFAQRLAATLPMWGRSVAPYAEQVAHEFGRVVAGKWEARTPLTGRKAKAAAVVKARKADTAAKGRRSAAVRADTSAAAIVSLARCVDCGGALARPRHPMFNMLGYAARSVRGSEAAKRKCDLRGPVRTGAMDAGEPRCNRGPERLSVSDSAWAQGSSSQPDHGRNRLHKSYGLVVQDR